MHPTCDLGRAAKYTTLLAPLAVLALAATAQPSAAAVHAQLSWVANASAPQTDLAAPGPEATLYVTLAGFPAASSFKGGEIDLKWNPAGNALDCLTQTGYSFRTSAGTTCTYLNRGSAVPVTTFDDPGHLHVAWANTGTAVCAEGTAMQIAFDLSGCVNSAAVFELCSMSYLDENNALHTIASGDLGAPATIAGGSSYASPCNPGPNPEDLSWWNGFDVQGVGSSVHSIGFYGGMLHVGGEFVSVGDRTASRVASFNGTTWDSLGIGLRGLGIPTARALVPFDGKLVACGSFSSAGGNSAAAYVASWDGTAWSPVGNGLSHYVRDVILANGTLVAGGNFTGSSSNLNDLLHVAQLTGSAWTAMGDGLAGAAVYALTTYNGDVIAGGVFSNSGATQVANVARWTGTEWVPLGAGIDGQVFALAEYDGKLIAGGYFQSAGGVAAPYLAQWDGTSWSPVGGGTDGAVYALGVYNNTLVVTGGFHHAGALPVENLARWDGATWRGFGSGLDQAGHALASDGVYLYVGGDFTHAGGKPSRYIARWYDDAPTKAIIPPAPDGTGDPRIALTVTGSASRAAQVRFSVTLPEPSRIELRVFDVSGRLAMPATVSALPAGVHTLGLGLSARLASGVYTVQLRAGRTTRSHRFVVLR